MTFLLTQTETTHNDSKKYHRQKLLSLRIFEKISLYCQYFSNLIPLSFVLGFYINIVVQRWWAQYLLLPWPDGLSLFISTSLQGQDDRSRMMRRTIVRYLNLASTMTLRMVCLKVKKRFPTYDHLIEAGLLESKEKDIIESMESKTTHMLYWMPLVWAGSVVTRARKEKRIKDDFAVKTIMDEINRVRSNLGSLMSYDTISIPLVYTQVRENVNIVINKDPQKKYDMHTIDFYVPIFTYLQFFFYMGWLKVAESLVNPFGEDDDDFEVNYIIDRNISVAYIIVDEMHNGHPSIIPDMYWDNIVPKNLPYTTASEAYRRGTLMCSTDHFLVRKEDGEVVTKYDEENMMRDHPDDVESQYLQGKAVESSRSNLLLSNAVRIWRSLGTSVTSGFSPQSSVVTRPKDRAVLEPAPEIIPDISSTPTPSPTEPQKKTAREKIQVHADQEILSRAVSKEVHTSQSTSSPSSEMNPELMTQKERKEKSEKPDLNENHFCSADTEIVDEERRKSEAASESSDYGSSSKSTSRSSSSSPDDKELYLFQRSEYFPVYDRPSNYLQSNFLSKGMEIQNRGSKLNCQKEEEKDLPDSKDGFKRDESKEGNKKSKDDDASTEFWF
ncbi:Bestrophin-3 [Armadillidium nasatum]|uniref:Bestrophin homolog n=1 Tax=Armadillidium nasatum TaxID=96803 RepID=A0A5N5T0B9_9CRUS|nr:Bestrophin-3 [Armadillidium nasatum]